MSVESVQLYLNDGFEKVAGWCSSRFVEITAHLAEEMNSAGVVGGACEIGVYQGKFFLGLVHAVDGRPSLAIDLFDSQSENIDGSGGGRNDMLAGFRGNVSTFGFPTISDLQLNSFSLTVQDRLDIIHRFGPFQLFSIDGGHMAEHVVNDFKFADEVTHHGGAIIVDDITNPGWPGVMEGVAYIFVNAKPRFVPLIMGYNKLLLVGLGYHQRYFAAMQSRIKQRFPDQKFSSTKFFGYDMISLS